MYALPSTTQQWDVIQTYFSWSVFASLSFSLSTSSIVFSRDFRPTNSCVDSKSLWLLSFLTSPVFGNEEMINNIKPFLFVLQELPQDF